jgi:fructose-1,6-bisphosphatase/inositol monophosphatase family enzyme
MRLTSPQLNELADLAMVAANRAGRMIAGSRPQQVDFKPVQTPDQAPNQTGGAPSLASQVVTEIDRRSEELILDVLAPTLERFELGLLTEERDDDGGRLTADHFWCIDPLDGTLPFIEGSPGYAVSIALVSRNGTPLIGTVYDPVGSTMLHAVVGHGPSTPQVVR